MHDSRSPAHVISIGADTVAHGTPEMLRAVICEQLSFLAVNADLGRGHAQLGDDLALSYCVRRASASSSRPSAISPSNFRNRRVEAASNGRRRHEEWIS
jgi:hypothetical protein